MVAICVPSEMLGKAYKKILEAGCSMAQCLPEHCFTPRLSPSPRFIGIWFAIYVLEIVAIAALFYLY
jgi:hypothetical protein